MSDLQRRIDETAAAAQLLGRELEAKLAELNRLREQLRLEREPPARRRRRLYVVG